MSAEVQEWKHKRWTNMSYRSP